jgi:2-polyprenyl-3-methyl-5-hydroxy-6-metoxy-1,4-benzoquinol methylase
MNDYYDNKRSELKFLIPQNVKNVLEIGCGNGGFRENFKDVRYDAIEMSEAAATIARTKLDFVAIGEFEKTINLFPDNSYDLIVCNDVIEHIFDTNNFLKKIKEKLNINGSIIGSIPNVRHISNLVNLILRKDWQYTDSGILDNTHVRFFTKDSLIRLFKANNFQIEELEGVNSDPCMVNLRYMRMRIVCQILGSDTLYRQFAFRISDAYKKNN